MVVIRLGMTTVSIARKKPLRKTRFRQLAELKIIDFMKGQAMWRTSPSARVRSRWELERREMRAALREWDAIRLAVQQGLTAGLRDAKEKLSRRINRALERTVTLKIQADLRRVHPVTKPSAHKRELAERTLGGAWLQLVRHVTGEDDSRECDACQTEWFPERSDARFCSPLCKLRWNRARVRGR